jgi:phosphoenolpyruvate-protein kinase (PTS system EI component)
LQNFSNLRATRTVTPGSIASVNHEELEASLRESRAGIEVARRKQEEAVARQEAATARLEEMTVEDRRWSKRIVAELNDQRDERRALLEAIFRVMDRLD